MSPSIVVAHGQRARGTGVSPVDGAPRRRAARTADTVTTRAGRPGHREPADARAAKPFRPLAFDAAIFDMDGVITDTAAVHSAAWKRMFDEYLRRRAQARGERFQEFAHERDYRAYVDGRPRYQGVATFLKSRDIDLPFGVSTDPAGAETICGLGNRKNELFHGIIEADGVRVYPSTLELIETLRSAGIQVGLATSSKNSGLILAKTRTAPLFATVVDGVVSERLGLKGKPQPDIFLAACRDLGAPRHRAIVIEDAVSGVQAGANGGFGLVVGVARENNAVELREHGADLVVGDLAELTLDEIDRKVRLKAAGA
ncbi:HAD family hydrolase [Opitutus terrae]|uniref:Beta-phosphoglucomutase n=1 Tax=Opitutus terrae (strain DSM 11246 / JCM 15787 / PB90-1) TaxID=452637 RepID=B1ZXT4_OPITP|nr:beta-phosphoglucomutase family hydrolase [Opitutus terrae]ACB74302.1 beta-phosphoglucomutase family hydrolase [Opitutus terrae PB90-1]